jgi:hypothetical protein
MLYLSCLAAALFVGVDALRPAVHPRISSPVMSEYYAVYHSMKKGKSEAFWEQIASMDPVETAKAQHEGGIFAHNFLPTWENGPILCLWECKDETKPKEFQEFIDDLFGATLVNKPHKVLPSGMLPASAWPEMPAASVPSTGSFFWVDHTFKKGAAEGFWQAMADLDMAAFQEANRDNGMWNHLFLPTGESEQDSVFCVWESKESMSAAEFQTFIDSPDSPAGAFTNMVYPVMEGAMLPSAAFTGSGSDATAPMAAPMAAPSSSRGAAVGKSWMEDAMKQMDTPSWMEDMKNMDTPPWMEDAIKKIDTPSWMEDTMKKIEEFGNEALAKVKEAIKKE